MNEPSAGDDEGDSNLVVALTLALAGAAAATAAAVHFVGRRHT